MAVLISCTGKRQPVQQGDGTAIPFRYARLIHAEQHDGYRLVTVDNPWKPGTPLHSYILVSDGQTPPSTSEATIIRTPLRRSVIFTSVHAALVGELQAQQSVAGVADLKYMKVPYVRQGVASGRMADCGDGLSPLVEKIIDVQADAILLSPFENSGGYGRLEDIDIPIVECAEYMEQSPLARAEWMRFYGMLYGREALADSLFSVVEQHYSALQHLADSAAGHPTVVCDKMAGTVWYVPGGRSTIGQMLADAGADYPWAADAHSGSLQLPFETVLERAGHCQLWLLRYDSQQPLTLEALLAERDGYRMMKAVDAGQVYGCNVTTSMFYEETPFRPDLLLQDFIKILHPDIPNLPPLRYYHKIQHSTKVSQLSTQNYQSSIINNQFGRPHRSALCPQPLRRQHRHSGSRCA